MSTSSGYLDIVTIAPGRGAPVGVAHLVVVTFNHPVADRQAVERAIAVKSVPAMAGKFDWIDDNVVQWVPDRFWPAHSTVALSVGGVRTDFTTGPVVLGVADISNHTFTVTIDGVEAETPPSVASPHHRLHFGEAGVLPASMGRPEHGCISLTPTDAEWYFDAVHVGEPVIVKEGVPAVVTDKEADEGKKADPVKPAAG